MRNILPSKVAFPVLFCLFTAMGTGCDRGSEPKQISSIPASAPTPSEPLAPTTTEAGSKTDSSEEFSGLRSGEVGALADKALASNDVDATLAAIAELRKRENISPGTKMEIARVLFGAGAMKDSAEVYDEVLEANPAIKSRLWQRGLALYYADEFEKGVDQFESHQTYNSQDVENSVWHLLCQSRLTSVEEARKTMIHIERDSRIPMKEVFDMFAGTGSPEEVLAACGYEEGKPEISSEIYHGLIYVGLFYEMTGDQAASQKAMTEALAYKPPMNGLMGHVAEGHLRARKAYPVDQQED